MYYVASLTPFVLPSWVLCRAPTTLVVAERAAALRAHRGAAPCQLVEKTRALVVQVPPPCVFDVVDAGAPNFLVFVAEARSDGLRRWLSCGHRAVSNVVPMAEWPNGTSRCRLLWARVTIKDDPLSIAMSLSPRRRLIPKMWHFYAYRSDRCASFGGGGGFAMASGVAAVAPSWPGSPCGARRPCLRPSSVAPSLADGVAYLLAPCLEGRRFLVAREVAEWRLFAIVVFGALSLKWSSS